MSNSILYHGSTCIVKSPLANIGRQELDFGPGFYLTHDREQAEKWARTKAGRKIGQKAILNVYSFDELSFASFGCIVKVFEEYSLEWLDFVAASRKGSSPWLGFDWIEGGVANDNVISTVDAYVDGFITSEQALDKLVNEKVRYQICILNQEIIDKCLTFVEAIELQ